MTNREYTNAVGRRKETTATVKLYAKGAGNILVKTVTGKEYTLADYFGGNVYLYKNAVLPFTTLGNDVLMQKSRSWEEVSLGSLMRSNLLFQELW